MALPFWAWPSEELKGAPTGFTVPVREIRASVGAGFLYPLLDHCARERALGKRGIKALILYPLNALAAACSAACRPIDDKRGTIDFRRKVSGVLAKRAARLAYDRARGVR